MQILEIAAGTGRNLSAYPPGATVLLIDRSPEMVAVLSEKVKKMKLEQTMTCVVANAEELDRLSDLGQFDTIIDTFGLCSVDDADATLAACSQLLRPGGLLLLLEHGRGDVDIINKLLDSRASAHAKEWGCWFDAVMTGIVQLHKGTIEIWRPS